MNSLRICAAVALACQATIGSALPTAPLPPTGVIGRIDNLVLQENTYYVRGWACQIGQSDPIDVHVYLDAGFGQNGEFLVAARADVTSEPAVGEQCESTGASHRFRIPLTYGQVRQHAGRKIYIHGISNPGPHPLINRSGLFEVPSCVDLSYLNENDASVDLVIPEQLEVRIDEDLSRGILTVNGKLSCPYNEDYAVAVNSILVDGPGAMVECGTEMVPFTGTISFTMVGNRPLNPFSDRPGKEFVALNGGTIRLIGKPGKSGVAKLSRTAKDTKTIHVSESIYGWEVGDVVVIAATGFDPREAEERVIESIFFSGFGFVVSTPLTHQHWGETEAFSNGNGLEWSLDERAEVVNLTRNIRFISDDDMFSSEEIGAHMMISGANSAGFIRDVEFFRVGQMAELGRYPFHWHENGIVTGQYIKDSSIHESYNRCVTIHGTHLALVSGNACYDHFGHGYFLEDGNERKNRLEENIGILSKKVPVGRELLESESKDVSATRFPGPATFWISNPDNYVTDNIAAGSDGTGFWMAFHKELICNHPTDCLAVEGEEARPAVVTNTLEFKRNVAHSSKVGFTHDGGPNGPSLDNPRNAADRKVVTTHYYPAADPCLENLQAYKNSETGVYYRGERGTYHCCPVNFAEK